MANGFGVREAIARPPAEVWDYLTDFTNAGAWIPGMDRMKPADDGPLAVGTSFWFTSRGKERETRVRARPRA